MAEDIARYHDDGCPHHSVEELEPIRGTAQLMAAGYPERAIESMWERKESLGG